jgi:nucleotide-binding universal stress UspA family protein
MFKRILAATDMPNQVDPVVLSAVQLAGHLDASLYILHALESSSTDNRRLVRHFSTGHEVVTTPAYEAMVKQEIKQTYADMLMEGIHYNIRVVSGFPWEEILKLAREMKVDLVLMGPHSGRAVEKGVVRVAGKVGSTVEAVIQRERCPVMIVNFPVAQRKMDFKNILIPIDFSRSCECAVCFSVRFAKKFLSKIIVFHMIPVLPFPKYSKAEFETDVRHARRRIEIFCNDYLSGIEHAYMIRGGSLPHLEILKCAEQQDVDAVVMGSHTKEEKGKWYAGSAVERVGYRSKNPVIVITDPEVLTPWKKRPSQKIDEDKNDIRLIRVHNTE